ncbi:MAG TPA: hypothetical protein VH302_11420 [Bryobacteraceae bacterium]|jgi:hypothetical protein|nr:hypothetical protein [Bryobacteraceae bacterium]
MEIKHNVPTLGIRWTIGDVSDAGHEALRLSIISAWNLFGGRAKYAVCVNTVPVSTTATRIGPLPCSVNWIPVSAHIPAWLASHVTPEMAEGVAWKLMPVRVFPALHELSVDNDVILWRLPSAMKDWLTSREPDACLMAGDVHSALGQFGQACNYRALNSGIRGLPPGFDLEDRLRETLVQSGRTLQSELDEQGLQAEVLLKTKLYVISTDDVSICSPFPNHQKELGRCGAHFVGLNPKRAPWILDGRPAHEVIRERWNEISQQVKRRVERGPQACESGDDGGLDMAVLAVR